MMCVYIWINSGLMKVLWIERFWFFCLVMGIRIVIVNPLGIWKIFIVWGRSVLL